MIHAKNIFFTYKSGRGIFDINFFIPRGEVFGFLGPNGAGKSTTLRTLLGFLKPTMGEATIEGVNCWNKPTTVSKSLGYLPGEVAYLNNITGLQFLTYMQKLRHQKDTKRRDTLIERFQLDPHIKIKKLSKGNKQKIALINAFMHDPDVYILDEPTSGLDPLMQSTFINLLQEEKARGKTILLSSHIFEEIDKTADRVGIIRDGRMVQIEDIRKLKATQQPLIYAELRSKKDVEKLQKAQRMSVTSNGDLQVIIDFQGDYNYALSRLSVCNVQEMTIRKPSLEELFFQYYEKDTSHE